MFINFSPSQNTNPSFGHRLPKGTFHNVKEIPNMRCVICDEVMLTTNRLNDYIKGFGLGASQCLKDERFSAFKNTPVYHKLKEISKKHPKTSFLLLLEENKESLGISEKLYKTLYKIADEKTVPSSTAIKKIDKFYNILGTDNQKIVDHMSIYAKKYPNLSFSEIFHKDEVYGYHFEQTKILDEKFKNENRIITRKIYKLYKKLPLNEQKQVNEIIRKIRDTVNKYFSKNDDVTNYNIISEFRPLLQTTSDKDTVQKIINTCIQYPRKKENIHFFVVFAVNNDLKDKDIFKSILKDGLSTFEHIKLSSQSGTRRKSNGLYDHQHCNKEGGNIPMRLRIENNTALPERISRQCNRILTLFRTGHLKGYDDFLNIQKTFDIQAPNLIKINLKRYYSEQIKAQKLKIKEREKMIEDINYDFKDIKSKIYLTKQSQNRNEKELNILKEKKLKLHNKRIALNNEIVKINKKIQHLKKELEKA